MNEKIGRNDPCPCGSKKKYKQCCWGKEKSKAKKKLTASWINRPKPEQAATIDLMERTFGQAIALGNLQQKPPVLPNNEDEKKDPS